MAGTTDIDAVDLEGDDSFVMQTRGDAVAQEETPACQSCRKKKSKCSRNQPCSQCVKSGVDCIYEDRRLKGGIKTGVIERLNQRIDTIENMFLGQGILLQQLLQAKDPSTMALPRSMETTSDSFPAYADRLKKTFCSLASNSRHGSEEDKTTEQLASSAGNKRKRTSHNTFVPVKTSQGLAETGAVDMCELIPPSTELDAILDKYFKFIHPWIPVLHPATFLRRVRDPDRPNGVSIVVQAIVAVASDYLYGSNDTEVQQERRDMRQYASECRQNVITSAIESNSKESIQALLLVTFDSIKRGLSVSPWSLVAIICRKIDDLQLYSEELIQKEAFSDYFLRLPPTLEAANAWIEVEERRRVFWAAFLMDRFCSITTGANSSISSKSIRRRLPCDGYMWELDQCVETSFFKTHEQPQNEAETQEAESPFPPAYSNTEGPSGIGGLAYTIEATESLFLVTKFHARHTFELDNSTQLSSWLNKFRQLDSRLLQWELCLTHRWRDVRVVNGYIDPNLTLAHMTHNAAIIVLHRRLAHPPPSSRVWLSALVSAASREACVMAAIKIDKIAKRYLGASDGIPPHQFVFCLYVAGQLFISQAAHQSIPPAEELGSIITALNEVSRRLNIDHGGQQERSQTENPAAKFSRSLTELRDNGSKQAVVETPATTRPQIQGGSFSDLQFMSQLGEMPTMLQHCATSPSSGISWFGAAGLDADSPNFLGGDNMVALTHSLLPNARIANNMARTQSQSQSQAANAQSPNEFDFMTELRKLESRAREYDRKLVEGELAQQKKSQGT